MRFLELTVAGAGLALATALVPAGLTAQNPAAATFCTEKACAFVIDWGPGKSAGDYAADIRYGSASDFEATARRVFANHGAHVQDKSDGAELVITLRPQFNTRAMCEMLPGTNTSYGCTAMSDLAVSFASSDPAVKGPSPIRLANRCGGGGTYLTMVQFGQYVGDMLWWTIAGSQNKEKKPAVKC
jgi:hypothetical protein